MNHITYLSLAYNVICLPLSISITVYSFKILVFNNGISKKISLNMKLYFVYVFIFSIFLTIYFIYCIAFWRPNKNAYDGRLLFIFGFLPYIFMNLNCLVEFFLCFDRCLALLWPLKYNQMVQKRISYFSISVVFIVFIISLPGVFESLPDTSDTDCQFVVCVIKLQPLFAVMKVIPVFGCFGASITLAVLIKYKLHLTNKFNTKISKTVIKIIFITTATEMVPLLASGIFMAITHNSLILYIGSLPFALSTLAVAISAKIYYNLFKKVINKQATSSPQIFN